MSGPCCVVHVAGLQRCGAIRLGPRHSASGKAVAPVARAAFRAAVEQYPKVRIRLRNRALVMEEYKPDEKGAAAVSAAAPGCLAAMQRAASARSANPFARRG